MRLAYPVTLIPAEEGGFLVGFPDFPEAHSQGEDKAEALTEAVDCLEAVLAMYMRLRRTFPHPSRRRHGQHLVQPGSLIATKAALYLALAESGVSQRELARRLRVPASHVTRLLDPAHHSRLEQIDAALAALGKRLAVSVERAA